MVEVCYLRCNHLMRWHTYASHKVNVNCQIVFSLDGQAHQTYIMGKLMNFSVHFEPPDIVSQEI